MNRRRFIAGSTAALTALSQPLSLSTAEPAADDPFGADTVRQLAKRLAGEDYKEPDQALPKDFQTLSYDAYRNIRFRPERALWRDERLPFQVQFFHRGWLYPDRVQVYEVNEGTARQVAYTPDLFDFGPTKPPTSNAQLGFAGFRLHALINRPDYYDEVGVFLGASYFRAVGKGQLYGLSARGLSIGTGDPKGEEFPAFRSFWIERPTRRSSSIVVHALLDSKSAAAAMRFVITPGSPTVYDTQMALYPRLDIDHAGIGSLTSMFFFAPNDRAGVDDFRPAVHDSDGLWFRNERQEEIWRPLSNPRDLQVSVFSEHNPVSFGLLQRKRDFHAYEDIESRFEKRPSAWVEVHDEWGDGALQLLEIPTKEEIHDNIVAFWRPKEPLRAKREYNFNYRLNWGERDGLSIARFATARIGAAPDNARRFVLELVGGQLRDLDPGSVQGRITASRGQIRNLVTQRNPITGGIRISFELVTNKETLIELYGQLMKGDVPVSEIWLYRWTPS